MSDLGRLIDLLDSAVSQAVRAVGHAPLSEAVDLASGARRRVGYLGQSVVVALAGGTGSGKSSLLNAIAGATVAEVAAIRPTTSEPLAWMPQVPEPGVVRLLDDMGVERRVGHTHDLPVVLIDMPDTDSVVGAHRATFERLLPRVDVVWWVVDPEKYSDRLLHRDFLGPLAEYQDQFRFVFNQIDRLTPEQLGEVLADFAGRLRQVGIADPVIIPVAASPVGGQAIGIDRLIDSLVELGDAKRAVTAKTIVDVRRAGALIADVTGVTGPGVGFEDQWDTARVGVVAELVDMVVAPEVVDKAQIEGAALALRTGVGPLGLMVTRLRNTRLAQALGLAPRGSLADDAAQEWASRPGRDRALGMVETLVSDLAFRVGGPFARAIRSEFDTPRLSEAVDRTVDVALHRSAHGQLIASRWWSAVGAAKWLLSIAVVWGVVWWYARPPARGTVPWSLVMVFGGVVIGLALSRWLDASGRRLGRERIIDFRQQVGVDIDGQLERSLGQPLRSAVRDRAELAALLAQLSVETERAQRSA